MSTEQSLDPQLIEQTKQQIRTLVNEIAQLSKSEIPPEEFHAEFLPRVVSALAAIGGAVWTVGDEGRLSLGYQINIQETKLRDKPEEQVRHGRLVHKVFTSGEPLLVPPNSGAGDDSEAGNPTDFLLVLGPVKTDLEVVGVVEVFQRPETRTATQRGYLRFLIQMCELAGDYFKSRQLRHFSDRQVLWTQLEDFARRIHASLDPRETAYTIANEGRRLIECDRVSIAVRKGRKCTVEAVSGQDLFDKRSNTVRLLNNLATAVVSAGEPVWYTGDTTNMAPQVEEAVQEYVDESHSKTVAVLPLSRPPKEETDDPTEKAEMASEGPIGALIVELIEDSRVPAKMRQRVDVVAQHSATALANALEHHNLFLMPVWKTLGKSKWLIQGSRLPKTTIASILVVVAILFLALWPADFEIEAKGTLEPVDRRDVYAEVDGRVVEVPVKHGQLVEPGQTLVRLEDNELEIQIQEARGQEAVASQAIDRIFRTLQLVGGNKAEAASLQGQYTEEQEKLVNARAQLALLTEKQRLLNIVSPIRGQVVTADVYNLLIRRPVQRGVKLMRVADWDGPWRLEVLVPDHHIGFVRDAEQQLEEYQGALPVEFILKNDPGTKRRGTMTEVDLAAEVHGEDGNSVRVKVAVDKDELIQNLPELRPGASATAKIYCGRRPIGYVWFHDAIAFVQSRILFRFF